MKSATFLVVFVLYCTKRRCSQIKPQLKVKIKDGCEAPKKPSNWILDVENENKNIVNKFKYIRP